jgi:hypothetical protein
MSVATAEKNEGGPDSPTHSQDAAYRETNQVPASQFRPAGFLDVADVSPSCVGTGGEAPAKPCRFSLGRRGIDGFVADVDSVIDRETAEEEDLKGYQDPAHDPRYA